MFPMSLVYTLPVVSESLRFEKATGLPVEPAISFSLTQSTEQT